MSREWWGRQDGLWRPDGLSLADLRQFRACKYEERAYDMRAQYKRENHYRGALYDDTRLPLEAWAKLVTTSTGDLCWGMYLMDPRRWGRTVATHLRSVWLMELEALEGEEVLNHPEMVYALDLLRSPDRWQEDEIQKLLRRSYWRHAWRRFGVPTIKKVLQAVHHALRAERMSLAGVDGARTRYTQRVGMRVAWCALLGAHTGSTGRQLVETWKAAAAPAQGSVNTKEV